jgi:phosphohistidine phosphatase
MKSLHLLRHAKSSWKEPGLDDIERPLNRRGIGACATMAAYMAERGIAPDLVLSSPARRARETFDRLIENAGQPWPALYPEALYLAAPETLLAEIRAVDDAVGVLLVLGHNPGLAALARSLAGTGVEADLAGLGGKFPSAALASFEFAAEQWNDVAPGAGRLVAYATPKGLAT